MRMRRSGALLSLLLINPFGSMAVAEPPDATRPTLPSLQQIVRHFDFEEPEAAPNALPARFYRYIAPSQGFPPFGSMRLTTDVAHSGVGSFKFDLGGGSMSARLSTAVIPILPLTDYAVSVWVRTDGLAHARARLVAWLHDKDGDPITASVNQSRLIETQGAWEMVRVEVRGTYPNAADLVLEVQVVQREQSGDAPLNSDSPRLQDITGRVWFDDIIVSHLPHVMLSMRQCDNLVQQPSLLELEVQVSELTRETLTARLHVFDLDGSRVFESSFPAPRGMASAIQIPIDRCGWYRAVLLITSDSGITRSQSLDFSILPASGLMLSSGGSDRLRQASDRFGVALDDLTVEQMAAVPDLMSALRCRFAVLPVWTRDSGTRKEETFAVARLDLIERLLRANVDLIFSLNLVPDLLAKAVGVEPHQVLTLLSKQTHLWQGQLDQLLVNFGLEVNRWQIGDANRPDAFWSDDLRNQVETAHRSFADYVPKPVLYPCWSLDQSILPDDRLAAYAVTIPYHIRPETLPDYAAPFRESGTTATACLESLPADQYSARQQVTDLLIRGLYAWRAGFEGISIHAPWSWDRDGRTIDSAQRTLNQTDSTTSSVQSSVVPHPVFSAWRNLSMQLANREFVGEVTMADGVHCWMLRGPTRNESTLVVWSDAVDPEPAALISRTAMIPMQLANGPILLTDAFGNTQTIRANNGIHTIPVGVMPAFIEHADLALVQFRGGIHVEPTFVPAVSKIHELQVVLRNPWDVTISGTIRFGDDPEWQLAPNVQEFTIQAGGEQRLIVNIIPQRSILAGMKQLNATIYVNADQSHTVTVRLPLDVGLENIDLTPSWIAERNPDTSEDDVIITQAVTNRGKTSVHLDVYLLADGIGQTRRTIAGLGPGETAVRTFRIPDGVRTLAGKQVRVGVAERDGLTRLNRLLTISPVAGSSVQTNAQNLAESPQ